MERPFDTAASVAAADSIAPDPDAVRVIHTTTHADPIGDGFVFWRVATVPNWWSDDEISEIVHELWPRERCTHAHDCCGHSYAGYASWAAHPAPMEPPHCRTIIISQRVSPNI